MFMKIMTFIVNGVHIRYRKDPSLFKEAAILKLMFNAPSVK